MTLDEIVGQVKAAVKEVEEGNYILALQDLIPILQDVIRVSLKGIEVASGADATAKREELASCCNDLKTNCEIALEEKSAAVGRNGEVLRALLAIIEKIAPLLPLFF